MNRFLLARGREDHTPWDSRASFEAWLQSDAFRCAHADGGAISIWIDPGSSSARWPCKSRKKNPAAAGSKDRRPKGGVVRSQGENNRTL
ncbi:MAG: hypothetical protein KatS3mg124_0379 [Porticoccaceae bacterium]|nr:MAG: hypothetical protein KatS3mg124_0379 [Porticoccaceae bacterium]